MSVSRGGHIGKGSIFEEEGVVVGGKAEGVHLEEGKTLLEKGRGKARSPDNGRKISSKRKVAFIPSRIGEKKAGKNGRAGHLEDRER
jgi:hypothetical protein